MSEIFNPHAHNCHVLTHHAANEAATAELAARIEPRLTGGDVIGLCGVIGSGKSFFSRSLITATASRLNVPCGEIPSPTFTLVQSYPRPAPQNPDALIWHCDLWRLDKALDIQELGLDEAMVQEICLIEWAEKLGAFFPSAALWLKFSFDDKNPDARMIEGFCHSNYVKHWRERLQ